MEVSRVLPVGLHCLYLFRRVSGYFIQIGKILEASERSPNIISPRNHCLMFFFS